MILHAGDRIASQGLSGCSMTVSALPSSGPILEFSKLGIVKRLYDHWQEMMTLRAEDRKVGQGSSGCSSTKSPSPSSYTSLAFSPSGSDWPWSSLNPAHSALQVIYLVRVQMKCSFDQIVCHQTAYAKPPLFTQCYISS